MSKNPTLRNTALSTSPENILLYLADDEEQQVREIFTELANQGFPVQNQTPHISITFAPQLEEQVAQRAAELLPDVLPTPLQRVGTVIFGTKRKQTVAWLLESSDELEIAAREISSINRQGRGRRWTPHLTMGLRLPREIVPDYVRALANLSLSSTKELTAASAGLWKPRSQEFCPFTST